MRRIICISDTHRKHAEIDLPDGDILVHAGDFSSVGTENEARRFLAWFGALPFEHKVLIAGNHDRFFEEEPFRARELLPDSVTYLHDEAAVVGGLKFYGSPWTPRFGNWAFHYEVEDADTVWRKVPAGIDVLVTHGPPLGILDPGGLDPHAGCTTLRDHVLRRIKPRLHVFGHLHEGYGIETVDETFFVNAAICDDHYDPSHLPIIVDL